MTSKLSVVRLADSTTNKNRNLKFQSTNKSMATGYLTIRFTAVIDTSKCFVVGIHYLIVVIFSRMLWHPIYLTEINISKLLKSFYFPLKFPFEGSLREFLLN